jgi:hypothetical protein
MRLWLVIQGVRFLWWFSEKCSSRMYLQNQHAAMGQGDVRDKSSAGRIHDAAIRSADISDDEFTGLRRSWRRRAR